MRTKAGFTIACCGALWLCLGTGRVLRAQAAASAASAAQVAASSASSVQAAAPSASAAQAASTQTTSTQATFQDSTNDLDITVGKTVLIDTAQPISRVAVGLGDIAQAQVVTPTEILVNGKAVGQTSLIVWDNRGGRQFYNVTVRASSRLDNEKLNSVRSELRQDLPGQPVKVDFANGSVFLRGTVHDLVSSQRAVEIAATAGKVVNLLNVTVPDTKPQILLKVRFCSVDRSLEKQLGINLFDLGLGNVIGGVTTGQFTPPVISGAGGGSGSSTGGSATGSGGSATLTNELNILTFFPGLNAGAVIKALQQKGVVEVLAEPNLLAADGKEASFLAGGEYPYPVVQGTATGGGAPTVTIMFKQYGVQLNFIPTVTPQGTIHLQVAPQVSALDYTNEVQIAGFVIPGITDRQVNTEVDLRDGQSIVIGGLLNNQEQENLDKIPFIGDIPILGKFFQSMDRTKSNTELVVIVTPEIVAPLAPGQPGPQLKYPVPFLPANSNVPMQNPDAKTAANTLPTPPSEIPVETLIESMKPEKPLVVNTSGGGGYGGGTGMGSSMSGGGSTSP